MSNLDDKTADATENTPNPAGEPTPANKSATTTKKKGKPAKKTLDVVRLKALAAEIDGVDRASAQNLVHRLETEEGLKLSHTPNGGGLHRVDLAGIKASSTGSLLMALNNWGNAARRAVLKAA